MYMHQNKLESPVHFDLCALCKNINFMFIKIYFKCFLSRARTHTHTQIRGHVSLCDMFLCVCVCVDRIGCRHVAAMCVCVCACG